LKLPWSHRISNRAKANHDATFQFAITQWATPVQAGVVNGVKGAIHVKNSDLPISDGYGFAAPSLKLADFGDGNESSHA
jgi:hypothetical protein